MPNITVTVSESARSKAHAWAAENNTSISAAVQFCLQNLPYRLPRAMRATGRWPKRSRQ